MIDHLNAQEINSVFHYQPLHVFRIGRQFGGKEGDCPVAEEASDRLLLLPFCNNIDREDRKGSHMADESRFITY